MWFFFVLLHIVILMMRYGEYKKSAKSEKKICVSSQTAIVEFGALKVQTVKVVCSKICVYAQKIQESEVRKRRRILIVIIPNV